MSIEFWVSVVVSSGGASATTSEKLRRVDSSLIAGVKSAVPPRPRRRTLRAGVHNERCRTRPVSVRAHGQVVVPDSSNRPWFFENLGPGDDCDEQIRIRNRSYVERFRRFSKVDRPLLGSLALPARERGARPQNLENVRLCNTAFPVVRRCGPSDFAGDDESVFRR